MRPVSCLDKRGLGSYGGSQMWYQDKVLVNSGCGIIAGLEVLLDLQGVKEIDMDKYLELMNETSSFIKPLRLPFKVDTVKVFGKTFMGSLGVMFWSLKHGLKKITRNQGIDCKIKSYTFGFEQRTIDLVKKGIPVILLIRAPFDNVMMYRDNGKPSGIKLGQHYVIVTDYDEERGLFVISSWGEKYKIDPADLKKFSVSARFCYAERPTPQ